VTEVVDFTMPSLGADMDVGTVIEWHVKPGDQVHRGDVVAIVETDKGEIDVEIWNTGVVTDILVSPGLQVAVGTPLARVQVAAKAGAAVVSDLEAETPARPEARPARATEPVGQVPAPPGVLGAGSVVVVTDGKVAASPLARRLATERGIDLAALTGSGPSGAITARDVPEPGAAGPAAAEVTVPAAVGEAGTASGAMRRAIAVAMSRSKREIPHYYLATDIDLETTLAWLEGRNAALPIAERILPAAALLKAVAMSIAQHPDLNGFWTEGGFRPADHVHLGVAVSLRGGGLVAPAIHDADRLSVPDLMATLRDLVARARTGRLRASEMSDPTITVTNLGDRGVDVVHGVIYPPQVALVGLGRIAPRPAVVGGMVVARRLVTATLAADHRTSDGQLGARFLNTLDRLLQHPEDL
jgi:pyruvate dehydrogenase E2 component (dihydrolipoamide acetyltransferase)